MTIRVSFAIPLLALTLVALPAPLAGQAKAKSQLLPNATVKSVSASSLVVATLGKDVTFMVDPKTKVVGKGIGTKSAAKGGKPTIADLLKEGDRVTVTYQDVAGTMRASTIEVAARNAVR
jgi:hypothetical protein